MIPDIKKGEWADIINGGYDMKLISFPLQMKLNELKIEMKLHRKNLNEAISELHRFVSSEEHKYQKDLKIIFKLP